MKFLADANFLVALASSRHEHHARAAAWFRGRGAEEVVLARVTQMSFLRLISNPKVMQGDVLTMSAAWNVCKDLQSDWRVAFLQEPAGVDFQWWEFLRAHTAGHNTWTDAYLAAFASGHGLGIVTFDRDFDKWSRVPVDRP